MWRILCAYDVQAISSLGDLDSFHCRGKMDSKTQRHIRYCFVTQWDSLWEVCLRQAGGPRISLPIGAFSLDPGQERTRILSIFSPTSSVGGPGAQSLLCVGATCRTQKARLPKAQESYPVDRHPSPPQSAAAVSQGSGKVEAAATSFTITLRPLERKSPLFSPV